MDNPSAKLSQINPNTIPNPVPIAKLIATPTPIFLSLCSFDFRSFGSLFNVVTPVRQPQFHFVWEKYANEDLMVFHPMILSIKQEKGIINLLKKRLLPFWRTVLEKN